MAEHPIYICDLDGTLLRSDGVLSDFARDGLNELLSAGMRLTVASSRATPAMRALLAGVDLRLPVIEFNGAFVSELESGRHLASSVLSNAAACTALPAARRRGCGERLMDWLAEEAARLDCEGLHLDSGVAADRAPAHRLYMRNGLRISAHHFEREV